MMQRSYKVTCVWDAAAGVWYVDVAESDVPGLVTVSDTLEAMEAKLLTMIPELLALNEPQTKHEGVPFELIARKQEMTHCA